MAEQFCRSTGIPLESTSEALVVSTPWGKSIVLNRCCPSYSVLMGEMFLHIDLFMMRMAGFDVILGMDWLAKYCAILDCAARMVIFHIPSLLVFQFVAEPRGESLSSFLASIVEDFVVRCIEQLLVICEYLDVFQEIPGLPPRRQIEFQIDLVPGTAPISKAP
ncbi:uncharacterized protein LOC131228805 [Magnolia sinica]|uniref:uncharacterized protein LOC131228805 n=1 Tax=Magnolia sinica TaxID=86752 RepID=UPI002658947E|nr:uncharacterized protein LOC131228805 [Magnolia sinica]